SCGASIRTRRVRSSWFLVGSFPNGKCGAFSP
ncbi:Transcription-repair-coupling factor, partial [Haemophilus influenzae]